MYQTADRTPQFGRKEVVAAVLKAIDGRERAAEAEGIAATDGFCARIEARLADGTWREDLSYREGRTHGNNGKERRLSEPSLLTLIYCHLAKARMEAAYAPRDPLVSLNCKLGCGITPPAKKRRMTGRRHYVLTRLKGLFYDRRDLHWVVLADQRRCYEHVRPKVLRRALKRIVRERWLVDFAVEVCFVDGWLPIGTPTSPLAHNIAMLDFHRWLCVAAPWCVGYADNCMAACATKEEAQTLMWRIRQWWWYGMGLRAKRCDTHVWSIDDRRGLDFCGYRLHRTPDKGPTVQSKGYCTVRKGTVERARQSSDRSWGSYFGLLRHADCYGLMQRIERKMKLRELTAKIRIERKMDAPNMKAAELARTGTVFTVYDYELRRSEKTGEENWVKMLIGIAERAEDGAPTGRIKAYEVHGGMMGIVRWLVAAEQTVGREELLPLEEVAISDQCGYIFAGSTNQIEYINA